LNAPTPYLLLDVCQKAFVMLGPTFRHLVIAGERRQARSSLEQSQRLLTVARRSIRKSSLSEHPGEAQPVAQTLASA
jgi:hypothetical protein